MADESNTSHIYETAHIVEDGKDIGKTRSSASDKGGNSIVAIDPNHEIARVIDHAAERALCRKFDYRLLPVLSFMCKSKRLLARLLYKLTELGRSMQCPR